MTGRGTLTGRITLLAVGVAVLTAVLAALLAIGLTRASSDAPAGRNLSLIADLTANRADTAIATKGLDAAVVRSLRRARIQVATAGPGSKVTATAALARSALTPARQRQLLAGQRISTHATIGGVAVFLQGRPTADGGVLLVQRRADADTGSGQFVQQVLIALLIAAVVAVLLSVVAARRLARPLRRIADGAREIEHGARQVTVPADGPREIADVAHSLNAMSVSLGRSESRQRDFLLSVSHDLRTPLTGITGYAESLATGVLPSHEAASAGEVILGEAQRLERLVADLLDLARLGADQPRLVLRQVDLGEVGHAAAAVWTGRCSQAGITFRYDGPASPVQVRTDPGRLRQIIDGLVENAARVTPAGRSIVLQVSTDSSYGVVEVRDGGPGLTEDDLAVAFEPSALYERYRGIRPVGTGLGLAIVGRLAALLGGNAEAGHAAEGGARFTVRLPTTGRSGQPADQ